MSSIAIIDGSEERLNEISSLLSTYDLLFAKNGKEGMDLIREKTPSAVIMNTYLDFWDGFELLGMMRQNVTLSRIPVILISDDRDREFIIKALQAGANSYVNWPSDKDLIPFKVKNIVEWEKQGQSTTSNIQSESKSDLFIAQLNDVIEKHLDNLELNMNLISQELSISSSSLQKNLKKFKDKSVSQYVREYRLMRSRDLMESGSASLSEISAKAGFRNLSYFSKSFKNYYGFPPSSMS